MNSLLPFEPSPPDGFVASLNVPFLNSEVQFTVWPEAHPTQPGKKCDAPTARQLDVAMRVLKWSTEVRDSVDEAAERYRLEVDEAICLADYELGHINRKNIRKHYEVHGIAIPSFEKIAKGLDYVWLLCACDWGSEHGMECIFRGREIVYCGESDCLYQQPNFQSWTHVDWV